MQLHAPVERGDGAQHPKHQPAAADEDFGAGAHQPPAWVDRPRPVPTAQVIPDLGVVWNIGAHDLVRGADQAAEQSHEFRRQPERRSTRPVGEGDDTDPVVGGHEELRVESRQYPVVPHDAMPAGAVAEEPEAHARQARIRLIVGFEHRCEGLGSEHRAVFVGTIAEQRREVPGHVACGRVDVPGSPRHPIAVGDGFRTAPAEVVPRREARTDPVGSDEVGIGHAQGFEDVFSDVLVERLPAHVRDDLAERGEPVVGVHEGGARFDVDAEAGPVALGERRDRFAELHAASGGAGSEPAPAGMEQIGDVQDSPGSVTYFSLGSTVTPCF